MATTTNYGWTTPDDTDLVKNGASAIRSLGTSVDTAVWNAGYSAGKNKIINGDFGIWQRGTSFSNQTTNAYTADRWRVSSSNSTIDVNQSSFTAGTAPVAGYEGQYFATVAAEATDTDPRFQQAIEDARTFAGQTITVSFWAKSTVTTDALRWVRVQQAFGSGGSATVNTDSAAITLTSSWARYSVNIAVPSVSGKTIGTGSSLVISFGLKASTAQTLDIWGVQLEAGSTATPFQTATGTKQGELAACQRYYERWTGTDVERVAVGPAANSTTAYPTMYFKVPKRTQVSSVDYSNLKLFDGGTNYTATSCTIATGAINSATVTLGVASGLTAQRYYDLVLNGSTGYLGFSAEL
jgi:hypothetical protein